MPVRVLLTTPVLGLLWFTGVASARADTVAPDSAPTLASGAIEIGVDASMTTVEGITTGAVLFRGGVFGEAAGGLVGLELAAGYQHVRSFDQGGLEVVASMQKKFRRTTNYPFVSVGGGLRYEEVGSFDHTWYPLGFAVGVRSLLGRRAGFRVEYRFRRILNDPSSDFSEHHLSIGLSLFFRNPADRPHKE
ncbi:MAG: hypothetical protein OEN01_10000 [Candidatus Krumholzibacteria bacterium]|nr:hypothetical protein [Candidatus Krumholzibacteria bacterium]